VVFNAKSTPGEYKRAFRRKKIINFDVHFFIVLLIIDPVNLNINKLVIKVDSPQCIALLFAANLSKARVMQFICAKYICLTTVVQVTVLLNFWITKI